MGDDARELPPPGSPERRRLAEQRLLEADERAAEALGGPPAVRPPTPATLEAVSQGALETMAAGLDAIRSQIDAIKVGTGGDSKYDAGSRIAFLAAKAGSIYEATRKADAARLKRLQGVTIPLVLAWYRQLDRAERDHLLGEFRNIDARKSGLA